MAFTSADLTAIENAIKTGHLTVKFRDQEITYRSIEDMMKVRAMIRDDLGESTSFEDRGQYVKTSRDLD